MPLHRQQPGQIGLPAPDRLPAGRENSPANQMHNRLPHFRPGPGAVGFHPRNRFRFPLPARIDGRAGIEAKGSTGQQSPPTSPASPAPPAPTSVPPPIRMRGSPPNKERTTGQQHTERGSYGHMLRTSPLMSSREKKPSRRVPTGLQPNNNYPGKNDQFRPRLPSPRSPSSRSPSPRLPRNIIPRIIPSSDSISSSLKAGFFFISSNEYSDNKRNSSLISCS